MKLSQLYLKKIQQSQELMTQRATSGDAGMRHALKDSALHFELDAEKVAHCVAMFGDMDCETFLIRFQDDAAALNGVYGSPWLKGVYVVENFLNS